MLTVWAELTGIPVRVATVFRPSLTMMSAVADVLADSTVSETVPASMSDVTL